MSKTALVEKTPDLPAKITLALGRPSKFDDFAVKVIELVNSGMYIYQVCLKLNISRDSICEWAKIGLRKDADEKYRSFSDALLRAKENSKFLKLEGLASEIDNISDEDFKLVQAKTNSFTKLAPLIYPELREKTQVNIQVKQDFTGW